MSYTSDNMASTGSRTVTAFFDDRDDAERAIEGLIDIGVLRSNIHMTAGSSDTAATDRPEDKGFLESLSDFFFPEEDRNAYAEGLSRGGFLLSVTGLSDQLYDAALDVLDDEGSVDIDERASTWRAEGWSGSAAGGVLPTGVRGTTDDTSYTNPREGNDSALLNESYEGKSMLSGRSDIQDDVSTSEANVGEGRFASTRGSGSVGDDEVIPVVEERLLVGKRDVSHGRVRVRSYTYETPVSEQINLSEERVEIERRPVDRAVSPGDDAFRERSIEAEERREEAVVTKEARVVEEIGLRRTADTHSETVSDSVRRTDVEIEDDRDEPNRPIR